MWSSLITIPKDTSLRIETCNTTYRSLTSVQLFMRILPFYPTPEILCFATGQTLKVLLPAETSAQLLLHGYLSLSEPIAQTATRSVQPFVDISRECRPACTGISCSLKIAPSHGDLAPYLLHASLGPLESIIQMESRSIQPFSHSSRQNVVGHVGA